jgi:superoxide reductase
MTERLQVYKCEVCGNIVEMVHAGEGELVCCGQPMKLMKENTVDASKEKHVPVLEKIEGGWRVKVGSVAHPMEEKHYIEWIELVAGDTALRQFLKPGMKPEAEFMTDAKQVSAREYCNLHGPGRIETGEASHSTKTRAAINAQINAEFYSAYLILRWCLF